MNRQKVDEAAEREKASRSIFAQNTIKTQEVAAKTTLLLFRCRNVIEQSKKGMQIVAEGMLLWGWRGTPQQKEFLTHEEAKALLTEARAFSELSPQARSGVLEN